MPLRLLPNAVRLCLVTLLASGAFARVASADEPTAPPDSTTPTASESVGRIDMGLTAGLPAALGTGMTGGIVAGVMHAGTLGWGARAAYSQATEYTTTWAVTHHEIRLRAEGALQRQIGRGVVGLRLGAGATVLYEARARAQAARLGDAGVGLNTSTWSVLPGGELEGFIALPIAGPFGLGLSAGPSLHVFQGAVVPGWLAQLTAVWWP